MEACAFHLLKGGCIRAQSAKDAEGVLANLPKNLSILGTLPPNLLVSYAALSLISG